MKKLYIKYNDGSSTVYTIKNSVDHMQYVNRHINYNSVESIVLQQYPKKDNEPVVFK